MKKRETFSDRSFRFSEMVRRQNKRVQRRQNELLNSGRGLNAIHNMEMKELEKEHRRIARDLIRFQQHDRTVCTYDVKDTQKTYSWGSINKSDVLLPDHTRKPYLNRKKVAEVLFPPIVDARDFEDTLVGHGCFEREHPIGGSTQVLVEVAKTDESNTEPRAATIQNVRRKSLPPVVTTPSVCAPRNRNFCRVPFLPPIAENCYSPQQLRQLMSLAGVTALVLY